LRLGDARFGTNFTMLEKMQKMKIQIQQMEISFNEKKKFTINKLMIDLPCVYAQMLANLFNVIYKILGGVFLKACIWCVLP
jgi:hypothetical protein